MLAGLPYEYVRHLDRDDRVRRTHDRPSGSRVRRAIARRTGD